MVGWKYKSYGIFATALDPPNLEATDVSAEDYLLEPVHGDEDRIGPAELFRQVCRSPHEKGCST